MEFLEASIFQKGYIDGITILNLDGEILFSAKFNKKLSNLDESQQLIGQKFLDVYPNLTPQSSTLYRAMQFGRPVYEEKQYLKKRGKDGILITSISFPIKNGDRIVGAIDLSMQKSEEEEDELPEGRIELSRDSFHRDRTQKLSASASQIFLPFLMMTWPFSKFAAVQAFEISVTFTSSTETPPCCTRRRPSPLEGISPTFSIRSRILIAPSVRSAAEISVVGIFSVFAPPPKRARALSCALSASSLPCTILVSS